MTSAASASGAARGAIPAGGVLGQPEVEELGSRLGDHHVAGLEVAMDQAVTMRRSQRVGDVCGEPQCLRRRQRATPQPRGERLAVHVLQYQEVQRLAGDRGCGAARPHRFTPHVI